MRPPAAGSAGHLSAQVANRLVERLDDIHESYSFSEVVDLGCGSGHVRRALGALGNDRHIRRLREFDMSPTMLERSRADAASSPPTHGPEGRGLAVEHVLGDEEVLNLERESADLIVSCMGLHWVNDLPSTLRSIRRALKPNGLFLGAFLGGETLAEMRSSFVSARARGGFAFRRVCPTARLSRGQRGEKSLGRRSHRRPPFLPSTPHPPSTSPSAILIHPLPPAGAGGFGASRRRIAAYVAPGVCG
jgi:SAM-dependent methyltransferase